MYLSCLVMGLMMILHRFPCLKVFHKSKKKTNKLLDIWLDSYHKPACGWLFGEGIFFLMIKFDFGLANVFLIYLILFLFKTPFWWAIEHANWIRHHQYTTFLVLACMGIKYGTFPNANCNIPTSWLLFMLQEHYTVRNYFVWLYFNQRFWYVALLIIIFKIRNTTMWGLVWKHFRQDINGTARKINQQ